MLKQLPNAGQAPFQMDKGAEYTLETRQLANGRARRSIPLFLKYLILNNSNLNKI